MTDMTPSRKQLVWSAMRLNLYWFLNGMFEVVHPGQKLEKAPYLEAMCFALQEVAEGRERRLSISIAPRSLKSFCASVLLPAWILGHFPEKKIMVVSYGSELERDQAEKFRAIVESTYYQRLFPGMRIDRRSNRLEKIRTTDGGYRMSVSRDGSLTGFGADLIILDDLTKAGDAHSETMREKLRVFFDETAYSRLNEKRSGAIIAVQQRLHVDDIAGYLEEKGTFRRLCLPAIAETRQSLPLYRGRSYDRKIGDILSPRENKDTLDQIKQEMGPNAFYAQYQQNPRPGASEFLCIDDLHLVDTLPDEALFIRRVQSWDPAAKDGPRCDYSVGMTFGWHREEERWYILDIERARLDYTALKDRIISLRKRWNSDYVIIENSALGMSLLPELMESSPRTFKSVTATEGKIERFLPATDWLKQGRIKIPTDAPWFNTFRRELLAFPNDTKDDQVDALSQFVNFMRRSEAAYLDKDPKTGRRRGVYRRGSMRR